MHFVCEENIANIEGARFFKYVIGFHLPVISKSLLEKVSVSLRSTLDLNNVFARSIRNNIAQAASDWMEMFLVATD